MYVRAHLASEPLFVKHFRRERGLAKGIFWEIVWERREQWCGCGEHLSRTAAVSRADHPKGL